MSNFASTRSRPIRADAHPGVVTRPWIAQDLDLPLADTEAFLKHIRKQEEVLVPVGSRVLRRGSPYEDAGAATLQFDTSLVAGRAKIDWPETGQAKQIAALHGQVDALRADVDSLRDYIARVESGASTMVETSSTDLRKRLGRQCRLTNDEALLAGLAFVLGAVLSLAGDLLA